MTDYLMTVLHNEAVQLYLLGSLLSVLGTLFPKLQSIPLFGLLVALSRRTTLDVTKSKPGGS